MSTLPSALILSLCVSRQCVILGKRLIQHHGQQLLPNEILLLLSSIFLCSSASTSGLSCNSFNQFQCCPHIKLFAAVYHNGNIGRNMLASILELQIPSHSLNEVHPLVNSIMLHTPSDTVDGVVVFSQTVKPTKKRRRSI